MDEAAESSRESDPVTQIEARTMAFKHARHYRECTASIPTGNARIIAGVLVMNLFSRAAAH